MSNEDEVRAQFEERFPFDKYGYTLLHERCFMEGYQAARSAQPARIAELEQQVALYQEDIERCWSHMPHLRNTEACYEVHEAVHELTRERDEAIRSME